VWNLQPTCALPLHSLRDNPQKDESPCTKELFLLTVQIFPDLRFHIVRASLMDWLNVSTFSSFVNFSKKFFTTKSSGGWVNGGCWGSWSSSALVIHWRIWLKFCFTPWFDAKYFKISYLWIGRSSSNWFEFSSLISDGSSSRSNSQ
jgi:hypothetical protein